MLDAYIYSGFRSAFGRFAGKLAAIRPDDLAAEVLNATLKQSPFAPSDIEDVILGCANQAGEDSRNIARNAILAAGLPPSVTGMTVNRLCASGLAAVVDAARAISCGEGELYLAGGVESMTRAPFVLAKAEDAFSRELRIYDSTIGARFPNAKVMAQYGNHSMPETGNEVAKDLGISRDQADEFAAWSQKKYAAARKRGFFATEITPIFLPPASKGAAPSLFIDDEHPRPDSDVTALARLKPLFSNGVVTAGNASGVNDGAVALLVGSSSIGEKKGIKPLARILSSAVSGVEPRVMGLGPVEASRKALQRAQLQLSQIDTVEINEAFAAQVLACLKLLGLSPHDGRINPNGGAIAVGHPLGATGARLVLTACRHLDESDGRYALVSLCIGMGQGLAVIIERCR